MGSRATKFDKVVRRDICEKITVGTRTFAQNEEDFLLTLVCEEANHAEKTDLVCTKSLTNTVC